jgi:hypothetical protein
MAVQLHGRGQLPDGGPPEAAIHHRRSTGCQGVRSRSCACPGAPLRRRAAAGQGAQQAFARRSMQLVLAPPCAPVPAGVRGHLAVRVRHRRLADVPGKEAGQVLQEEGRAAGCDRGGGGGGQEVPALRDGQDAAVEDGAHGPQDALQRVRRPVQVGPPRAGGEPDVRGVQALQLPPQGAGAAPAEGGASWPAPPAACGARRRRRRRRAHPRAELAAVRRAVGAAPQRGLLDPQPHRPGLPSAHLGKSSAEALLETIQ